ncbi:MAG: hypothetical protein NUV84_02105, partial [Candidatus Uhrbacteria bacterium]|nr:hypothetical protein [Candidatus Uhrbacteria bacterium]
LIECKPDGDVEKTLAIGYFLEAHQGLTAFNKNDLEQGFRAAKERVPANINDKVNKCIGNGHMMEAEEKKDNLKAWVVTSRGEGCVKRAFKEDKTE